MRVRKNFYWLIIFLVLAGGCAANRQSKLEDLVFRYSIALRRADFRLAAGFADSKIRGEFLENSKKLDGYTITNVEMDALDVHESGTQASNDVLIELYEASGNEVSQWRGKLNWKYDEALHDWLLTSKDPIGASKIQ